ncbi:MAG: hypothetical protein CYPHOPRED_003297 [Cyphobasidiales sp. Tagirdzhanova-0007]|nr:MAG: hypothetical protein CYPHOPRED_003297 [Cyphobasidiales sp. Tagirdzhanova-0007]
MDSLLPGLLDGGANSTLPLPVPPVDRQACSLLGGTGLVVQGLMAVLVLFSLLIKRFREHPPRTWPVWAADVGKQIIGQAFLHSSNILISTLFSHHRNRDACTAYFLSIFVDCTLGVLVIFATLRLFSWILISRLHLPGFRTGQYYPVEPDLASGDLSCSSPEVGIPDATVKNSPSFQLSWWARQLIVYLLTLCIMKAAILGFFWIPAVFVAGDWILSWLGQDTKIVFVLMIFPLAMNAFQFLIIDAILKSSQPKSPTSPSLSKAPSQPRRSSTNSNNRRGGRNGDDEENQAFLSSNQQDFDQDFPEANESNQTLPAYHQPESKFAYMQKSPAPNRQDPAASPIQQVRRVTSHTRSEYPPPSVSRSGSDAASGRRWSRDEKEIHSAGAAAGAERLEKTDIYISPLSQPPSLQDSVNQNWIR